MLPDQSATSGGLKVCPFCAEKIKRAAKVCRYCGRELTPQEDGSDPYPDSYFLWKDEQQVGPYTFSQIQSLIDSGTFTATDLAWFPNYNEWKSISEIPWITVPESGSNVPPLSVNESGTIPSRTSTKASGYDPLFRKIESREDALRIVKRTAGLFIFVGILDGAIGFTFDKSFLVAAILVAIGAFFLYMFKSRAAAICLMLLTVVGAIDVLISSGSSDKGPAESGLFITLFQLILTIRAVEATFKIHGKFNESKPINEKLRITVPESGTIESQPSIDSEGEVNSPEEPTASSSMVYDGSGNPIGTRDEIELFVRKRVHYYLREWTRPQSTSWIKCHIASNYAAFLCPLAWLVYRKMYFIAAIVFACCLVEGFLLPAGRGPAVGITTIIASLIVNKLYLNRAKRVIRTIKSQSPDEQTQKLLIAQAGGTNPYAMAATLLLVIPLSIIAIKEQVDSQAPNQTSREASIDDKITAFIRDQYHWTNILKLASIPPELSGNYTIVAVQKGNEDAKDPNKGEDTVTIVADSIFLSGSETKMDRFYSGDADGNHYIDALSEEGKEFVIWNAGEKGRDLGIKCVLQTTGDDSTKYFLK